MNTIRENGGTYTTGSSDGHIWNTATGECSPLCPAEGGHSRSLLTDEPPTALELRLRIMASPHTVALHTAEGELQPWVLSEPEVRDLIEHGKGAALLRLCLAWDPEGCPACGRSIDRLGGNPECQECAGEPASEEATL